MQQIAVANGTIGVEVRGTGSPILFVHGFPLSHAMWSSQIAACAKTQRTLTPDLRGFGASSATPATVTMENFADDLHALLQGLSVSEPVILCGLSMGGYVAWQFFRKYRKQLRALILCDTRAGADTSEAAAGRRKLADAVLAKGPQPAYDAMLPRLFASQTPKERPEVVAEVRSMILQNQPAGIAAALRGMAERPDCNDLLPQIDVPTLVLCGVEDQITPSAEMQAMARTIRAAQFVEIPAAGHMSPLENPAAVNAAITAFLASLRK